MKKYDCVIVSSKDDADRTAKESYAKSARKKGLKVLVGADPDFSQVHVHLEVSKGPLSKNAEKAALVGVPTICSVRHKLTDGWVAGKNIIAAKHGKHLATVLKMLKRKERLAEIGKAAQSLFVKAQEPDAASEKTAADTVRIEHLPNPAEGITDEFIVDAIPEADDTRPSRPAEEPDKDVVGMAPELLICFANHPTEACLLNVVQAVSDAPIKISDVVPLPTSDLDAEDGETVGERRNKRARTSTAPIFFFPDPDVIITGEFLKRGLEVVKSGKAFFPIWEEELKSGRMKKVKGLSNCFISKEDFEAVGGFPEESSGGKTLAFLNWFKRNDKFVREEMQGISKPWSPKPSA